MQVLNPHINMALQCIVQVQALLSDSPKYADIQRAVSLLSDMKRYVESAGKDIMGLEHCIAEQARKLYGAVIHAQSDDQEFQRFGCITQEAYNKGKAQAVEDELRSASVSAPKLIRAIRTNEALGYLDTRNLSSTELYDLLNEHFQLTFKKRNFTNYRNK